MNVKSLIQMANELRKDVLFLQMNVISDVEKNTSWKKKKRKNLARILTVMNKKTKMLDI